MNPVVADGFLSHVGPAAGAGVARSIVASISSATRVIESGFFVNIGYAAIGFGVWVAGWIAQFVIGWLLWKILMCGKPQGHYSDHNRVESLRHAKHVPVYIGPTPQQQQPLPPAASTLQEVIVESQQIKTFYTQLDANGVARPVKAPGADGVPRLVQRVKQPVIPQVRANMTFQSVPAVNPNTSVGFNDDGSYANKNHWHGHERSRYESYVRLAVVSIRLLTVLLATILSFMVAGVNFISLATGLGLISVSFSYGAASMISNVFSSIYIYGTDKLELHDYVAVGGISGEVTALRALWIEVTDDFQPWRGRMVHHLPSKIPLETIFTIFPYGPPPDVIKRYEEDLVAVDTWAKRVLS